MMDSMQWNPRPTRAEASDVANAIWDGTDAVMLSGESAAGKYPVESVQTMARIAARAESVEVPGRVREASGGGQGSGSVTAAVGASVAQIADALGAAVIVTYTQSGYAARMVARERPHAPILAVTPSEHVARCLRLVGGVVPIHGEPVHSTDQLFEVSLDRARQMSGLVKEGDLIVLTAGVPVGGSGATNLIRVHKIGE
jgi:pyruvate kinase